MRLGPAAFIVMMMMPRLLVPLFVASVAVGLSLYVIPWGPSDKLSAVLHPLAYFSFWLVGVGITRLCRAGHAISLATGAYLFVIGICIGRVPFAEPAKYDFLRLLGFSLGFGFLLWAFVSQTIAGAATRRTLVLSLVARCVISAVALAILWKVSTAHLSMKLITTMAVAVFTFGPAMMVRGVTWALRPLQPFLVYVGGLSYALYLVHYPLVQTFNALGLFGPIVSVAVAGVLSFALAHFLDYMFQPWVRARIPGGRRRGTVQA